MIDQLLLLVRQLTVSQRIGILFGAVLTVLMTVGLVLWAGQPAMQAAFTNVATSDAATITGALTSAGIPYALDNGGSTISVPASKVAEARIAADQAGYTGDGGGGFSLFDQQTLGASSFDQQVQLQRALQGSLANTIKKFDGVADATVTIVFAKTGVTTSADQPASASVWVRMNGGVEPSADLVGAIVMTVSGGVPGLASDNVTVVDAQGTTLAGPNNAASSALTIKATTERELTAKIQNLLDRALGPGKSEVQVTADLNLDKIEKTITTVAPIDTTNWTPAAVQDSVETYGGDAASGASGIPGTTSNVPGLPTYPNLPVASAGPSASPGASEAPSPSPSPSGGYLKRTQTVNYANSTDVEKVIAQPGTVNRLSAAVFVDKASLGDINPDDLRTAIAAAINADISSTPAPRDTIVVQAVAFAAATPLAASGPDLFSTLGGVLPTAGGTLLAGALVLLVWRNMRALRGRAEEMQLAAARMSMPALGMGEPAAAGARAGGGPGFHEELPQIPESPQARIGERLRQLAEQEPDEVANLVRSMLDDDERGRRR
jgi:flagellar M-ring protein FliF